MNPLKRYFFQLLSWFGVWCIVWVSMSSEIHFIRANGPSFVLQSILLFGLVYYAIPKLLFKNRLLGFLIVIILSVLLTSYLAMEFGPPRIVRQDLPRPDRAPPFVDSRFFRQLLIMSITCLIAVAIETFTLAQQKQQSELLAKAELMESELKFLKMQINPHFLFNALNNIYALSVTNSEKTQEGINTLSLMLRYVLYDCEQPQIELRKELEYIAHFIELFKLKSSDTYNIQFIEEVESHTIRIAPMLFVPFIENSFKHSGIEKRGDSFVNIQIVATSKELEFSVENSLPVHPHNTDSQGGIGIQNVKKRLQLLYPGTHLLEIKEMDTFKINLKLMLT
ncbi:MAG: histidine kinase [Cytophagales bacterium]|nr:histidine kinase [Cytophagales bacterium]